MSDMKCPVCGKQMKIGMLDPDDSMGTVLMSIMPCDCVCNYGASKAVWQELIRTRKELGTENNDLSDKIGKLETELDRTKKQLEIAMDALKKIDMRCKNTVRNYLQHATIRGELCDISFYARKAVDDIDNLEQITALEQKDK